MWLEGINEPADLRALSFEELDELAGEIRDFIVLAVAENSGHLGSNLGAVELTLALHRVFESPTDAILWDTGHQAYVHKIVTGRQRRVRRSCARPAGCPGYPSREESPHDYIENSHASTVLSYAYGLAVARDAGTDPHRHIVAVIGDGSMTGGMAYEALNNLGHSGRRVIIVLNDNGRSYAPTVSNLTAAAARRGRRARADPAPASTASATGCPTRSPDIRLNPTYVRRQRRLEGFLRDVPGRREPQAEKAVEAFKAAVREFLQPPSFFEALGVRYVGPGRRARHRELEHALHNAVELSAEGPIVVHVLTQKGRGYPPAEDDDEKHLHDAPVFDPVDRAAEGGADGIHAGVRRGDHQGGRGRLPARRDHRGDAGTDRPAAVPGPLPRSLLRRRHRRTARRHGRRRDGDGRPAAGRRASTRRSSTGRGTRSCTTSRCTGCR